MRIEEEYNKKLLDNMRPKKDNIRYLIHITSLNDYGTEWHPRCHIEVFEDMLDGKLKALELSFRMSGDFWAHWDTSKGCSSAIPIERWLSLYADTKLRKKWVQFNYRQS